MIKTNLKLLLTFFIGMILFSSLVLAAILPGVPNAFYGYVKINNQPAPDGTIIAAKIAGVQVSSTTTKNGKYGYDPVFYVDDPNNDRSGKIINFFVNGVDTGQISYFCNGCVKMLNLSATITISEQQQPPGVGGGGGGGPALPPTANQTQNITGNETQQPQQCQERWICSEWSACINGIQTRTCGDVNNCGTDLNKPLESQPCSVENITEEKPTGEVVPPGITGMFALLSNPVYVLVFALAVIAVLLIVINVKLFPRKKKK